MHALPAEKKTLLIISGSVEGAEAAKRAKELGLYVIVSDRDPAAPGFAHADSILIADADGADETSAAAERFSRKIRHVDGAISMAASAPMTLASVVERLGLAGPSQRNAHLACDKLAMKHALRESDIPVPWFAPVDTPQALARIAIEHGRDLVIKPVDSREGRGVQRLSAVADIDRAFALARSRSTTGRVMVERYLEGPQISTQSLVLDGHCATPALFDRNFEYLERCAPFFVQNGGELPSALPDEIQEEVKLLMARAAHALGVASGAMTADIVVHDGTPHMIDVGAMICGGSFGAREIPLCTGVDFIGTAIRLAVGDRVSAHELQPRRATPVVRRCIFPEPGRVVSISGVEDARAVPGIADVVITASPGDIVPRANDKRPSAAMLLASASSRNDALSAANEALARIQIMTE